MQRSSGVECGAGGPEGGAGGLDLVLRVVDTGGLQAGRTENRNLAETPVLDGISTHENPAKAQLHIR